LGGSADTAGDVGEVRKRIFRLIKNSLTLGFILIFLSLLRPELVSLIGFTVEGLTISGDLILNVFALLFVIYFGYFILVDVKYFLDSASARFGRKDRGKLQSITYDIAGLISLILASSLLTPILTSIQGIGVTIAKVFNITLLAIGFLIVYHLSNQLYSLVKQQVEKLIHETRQFRTSHQKRKSEGTST
jgi:predicted PurR-regulated permease PerM